MIFQQSQSAGRVSAMAWRRRALAPQVLPELAQKVGAARLFCSGGGSAGAASLAVERRVATALKVQEVDGVRIECKKSGLRPLSHISHCAPAVQAYSANLVQKNRPARLAR